MAHLRGRVEAVASPERTRALRELLRMDWRRAREVVLHSLVEAPWSDRELVLRALSQRADPIAQEALAWVAPLSARPQPSDEEVGRALAELAAVALRHDQTELARTLSERALNRVDDRPGVARARARQLLGASRLRARETHEALGLLQAAADEYEGLGAHRSLAQALDSLGTAHVALHGYAEAQRCYARSLELKVAHDDLPGQAITLGSLGRLALQRGDLDGAIDCFRRDLEIAERLGDDEGLAVMANQLGEAWIRSALDASRRGDEGASRAALGEARRCIESGVAPTRRGGSLRDEGFSWMMQGRLALAEGRAAEAEQNLVRAAECFGTARDDTAAQGVALLRAEAARLAGDFVRARSHAESALAAFEARGARDSQARAWIELALVFVAARDEAARRMALARAHAVVADLPHAAVRVQLDAIDMASTVGEQLVARGMCTAAEAARLVQEALSSGHSMGTVLRRAGVCDARAFADFLDAALQIPSVGLDDLLGVSQADAASWIPRRVAERFAVLPLRLDEGALCVAMLDPVDTTTRDRLALIAGVPIRPVYFPDPVLLTRALRRVYGGWIGLDRRPSPEVALHDLLGYAYRQRATEVHLDPSAEAFSVRVRVDGVLHEVDRVEAALGQALVAALCTQVGLGGCDTSLPCEGAGQWSADDARARVALRVATWPTQWGARVTATLHPPTAHLTLEALGFDADTRARLQRHLARPAGMVVVAGAPQSGRSTVLQALATVADSPGRVVVSLEDSLDTASTLSARTCATVGGRLDHGAALVALCRQPVDVAVVDEIRDDETLRHAVTLARRGRLVLAAVRPSGGPRWPVPDDLATASMPGVMVLWVQRLRRLCAGCKRVDTGPAEHEALSLHGAWEAFSTRVKGLRRYTHAPGGCDDCGGRGYTGQCLAYACTTVLAAHEPDLLADAARLLSAGDTSMDEIARAFGGWGDA